VLRVGLTGGIASGKSVVVRRLAARGLATMDLDVVAHAVTAPGGSAYDAVVAAFGRGLLRPDGSIDRDELGRVVFADAEARARLNAIVHPAVRAEEAARAARLRAAGERVAVSDAALLVEAGAHLRFDRLVVVHCPAKTQVRRLMARDRLTEAAARARIEAQLASAEKRRYAHFTIDTSGTLPETERAASRLADRLLAVAAEPRPEGRVRPERVRGALVHGGSRGPRGLLPRTLLDDAVAAGGIELGRLAERLDPPSSGPWYEAARPSEGAPWPEALAAALALWAGARGADEDWLDGAAASLARLTHRDDASIAAACVAARAARAVLAGEAVGKVEARLAAWDGPARRWGGVSAPRRIAEAVGAVVRHGADAAAARAAARAAAADETFAGALAGLVAGAPAVGADEALVTLAHKLGSPPT